jgi:hypothetical protein
VIARHRDALLLHPSPAPWHTNASRIKVLRLLGTQRPYKMGVTRDMVVRLLFPSATLATWPRATRQHHHHRMRAPGRGLAAQTCILASTRMHKRACPSSKGALSSALSAASRTKSAKTTGCALTGPPTPHSTLITSWASSWTLLAAPGTHPWPCCTKAARPGACCPVWRLCPPLFHWLSQRPNSLRELHNSPNPSRAVAVVSALTSIDHHGHGRLSPHLHRSGWTPPPSWTFLAAWAALPPPCRVHGGGRPACRCTSHRRILGC